MRIYNATNSQLNLPYPGGTVSIAPHAVSGNLGANTQTISLLVSAYTTDEIAFIVSGPFELNLCSSIPTVVNYVVQSLEEAIEKLEPKPVKKEEAKVVEVGPKKEVKKESKPKSVKKEEAKEVKEDTVITIAESEETKETDDAPLPASINFDDLVGMPEEETPEEGFLDGKETKDE